MVLYILTEPVLWIDAECPSTLRHDPRVHAVRLTESTARCISQLFRSSDEPCARRALKELFFVAHQHRLEQNLPGAAANYLEYVLSHINEDGRTRGLYDFLASVIRRHGESARHALQEVVCQAAHARQP